MKILLLCGLLGISVQLKAQCVVILRNSDTLRSMNLSIPYLGINCALRPKCMSRAYRVDSLYTIGGYVIVDTTGQKFSAPVDTSNGKAVIAFKSVNGVVKSGKWTFLYMYNKRKKKWIQATRKYDPAQDGSIDYEHQRDCVWKTLDTRMGEMRVLAPQEYPTTVSDSITRAVIWKQLHPGN